VLPALSNVRRKNIRDIAFRAILAQQADAMVRPGDADRHSRLQHGREFLTQIHHVTAG